MLLALAVVVIALGGCGGSTSLAGTYETTIPGHHEFLSGRWRFTLGRDGSIKPGRNVSLAVSAGSYWRGDTFVINAPDVECGPPHGTGTYKLKLSGSTLHFNLVSDSCRLRATILSYPYKKLS